MRNLVWNGRIQEVAIFSLLPALLLALASGNKVEKLAGEKKKAAAEQSMKKTFASPEEAGVALFEAAKASDQNALLAIFGPDGNQVLFTGDVTKDRENLQDLAAAYNQMHRWGKIKAGGEVLHIGADNYLFPIPLGQDSSGRWYFDTAAGKDEILARRIGKDERTAIAACEALSNAEHQYFGQIHDGDKVRQYAQKFSSDPGKQNGLYWPAAEGQMASPLGHLGDFAKALVTSNSPKQFSGYYYRILTKQGDKARGGEHEYMVDGRLTRGFAILAYPVEYRNSGIMSFIVGADGMMYQKDLGEQTSDVAATMNEYNPGDGWNRVITPPLPTRHNRG